MTRKLTLLYRDHTIYTEIEISAAPEAVIEYQGRFFIQCMSGTNKQMHGVGVFIETSCFHIKS